MPTVHANVSIANAHQNPIADAVQANLAHAAAALVQCQRKIQQTLSSEHASRNTTITKGAKRALVCV